MRERILSVAFLATVFLATVFLETVVAGAAGAQISPGELSLAHAALEGNEHCLECHRKRQGADRELCLTCHTLLRQRIDAGKGLHVQNEYQECRTCHIEHHGREFELVYWGDGGPESLEHHLTGFVLEAKHATLGCRDCHRKELVRASTELLAAGKDLNRTFLGLGTACLDCHADAHRGQFAAAPCTSCHEQSSWVPAPLFDHRATSFPLTGRHRRLVCEKCHPTVSASARTRGGGSEPTRFVRYRNIAASSCSDCHKDPHESRFGNRCVSCHATDSWQARIEETSFDHDRTRYPLRGLHRRVTCEKCHKSGKLTEPVGFDRCESCHDDAHAGQFVDRADRGSCTSCHDVEGFRPSRYAPDDHQRSAYPLEDSHLAVPCLVCHSGGDAKMTRFTFASTACVECHDDPHDGALDRYFESDHRDPVGCVSCHDLTAWRSVRFDHDRSDYPLEGAHVRVACESCHPRSGAASLANTTASLGILKLSGVPTTCAGCHEDHHGGQFDRDRTSKANLRRDGRAVTCTSCHTVLDWKPSRFDHNRDATYRLEGAHADVPCESCHPTVVTREGSWVRYRPLGSECSDCHRGGMLNRGGAP